jgi:hypothetical protein
MENSNKFKRFNIGEMNPDNQNWYELRLNGKFPERRAYHSCFMLGKRYGIAAFYSETRMFIYGGHDIREGSLDTLWMIELAKIQEGDLNNKAPDFNESGDKRV